MGSNSDRVIVISLVALIALALALCVQNVMAQSGTCPDWTNGVSPIPPGSYPGPMAMCASQGLGHRVTTVLGSEYPCGGGLQVDAWDPANQGQAEIYLVPPSSQLFPSGRAYLRVQISADRFAISDYDIVIGVSSFNEFDQQIGDTEFHLSAYPFVYTQWAASKVFTVQVSIPMVKDGYAVLDIRDPTGPLYVYDLYYFGFKLVDSQWPLPEYCEVDGQLPPTLTPTPSNTPTYTPQPTNTPTPSNTPTGTPPNTPTPSNTPDNTPTITPSPTAQVYPTSAGGTPSPFPTRTPQTISTVPVQPSPTRLGVVLFPTVSFPGVDVPTFSAPSVGALGTAEPFDMLLTPNATMQAEATLMSEFGVQAVGVISDWYTMTNWAGGIFSTTITNTTGLSSVVQIAAVMGESVAQPIGYVRALHDYMPNMWPLIIFLLLAFIWILLNLALKWVIPWFTLIFDLIKKLPFA